MTEHGSLFALTIDVDAASKLEHYTDVRARIDALLDGEDDWIAAMCTVACELHHAFAYFDWTGFYRAVTDDLLVVGPYQGLHGCLRIPFTRGVCGAAARTRTTQRIDDVTTIADHIACSSTTRSELVIPLVTPQGRVLGVLDIDSNTPAAFDAIDQRALEDLCQMLSARFADTRQR